VEAELKELLWLAPDDARRQRALARDPSLAARLAALEAAAVSIDAQAARHDGAAPADPDVRADEARALTAFAKSLGAPSAAAHGERAAPARVLRGPGSDARRWLLAAAAVVAALVVGWRLWTPQAREPVWLGAHVPGANPAPLGPVAAWSDFTWTPAPPPGSVHVVRAWRAENVGGSPDVESPPRTTPTWSPSSDTSTLLGAEFVWTVCERNPIDGTEFVLFEARVVVER
jgi:hypothetical protein